MLLMSDNHYYLCCLNGLIRVRDQLLTTLLDGTDARCIETFNNDTFILGTQEQLMIVDTNGVTNQIIMDGDFRSIKKVTDNTFILRSLEQLIVVHKL